MTVTTQTSVSPRPAEKRGPLTPLALLKLQNRKLSADKLLPVRSLRAQLLPQGQTAYARELMESKYTGWLLEKRVARLELLNDFLELERSFERDAEQ